jgi:hypothetical protein
VSRRVFRMKSKGTDSPIGKMRGGLTCDRSRSGKEKVRQLVVPSDSPADAGRRSPLRRAQTDGTDRTAVPLRQGRIDARHGRFGFRCVSPWGARQPGVWKRGSDWGRSGERCRWERLGGQVEEEEEGRGWGTGTRRGYATSTARQEKGRSDVR